MLETSDGDEPVEGGGVPGEAGWSERAWFTLVFLVTFPQILEILSLQFQSIFQKLFKVITSYLNYFIVSIRISQKVFRIVILKPMYIRVPVRVF